MNYHLINDQSHVDKSVMASWRNVTPQEFCDVDRKLLRDELRNFDLLGEPAWSLARTGDPGSAIGVAVRWVLKRRANAAVSDLTMSAVLLAALDGNAAWRAS